MDAIETVAAKLQSATNHAEVFGVILGDSAEDKKLLLKKSFNVLVQMVHPDRVPPEERVRATEVFRRLNQLRQAAIAALDAGTYDRPFTIDSTTSSNGSAAGFKLSSTKAGYQFSGVESYLGSFSVLYRGHRLNDSCPVLAKVATHPTNNIRLEAEAVLLYRFQTEVYLGKVKSYVPELLDTFLVASPDNRRFRVSIFAEVPDVRSVAEIMQLYPGGLEPQQAAWICRRILGQTLLGPMLGLAHTAIVPDHVLVGPITHEPLHIGWTHAITRNRRLDIIINGWKDYYPPEVFEHKPFTHQSDIYMAGKTMIGLLGGDVIKNRLPSVVPKEMVTLILACVANRQEHRPHNGKELLNKFTSVVRAKWGKEYKPLLVERS